MNDWDARFTRFAARKTQTALGAPLSAFTTDYDRARPTLVAIGSAWTHALFDGPFYVARIAPRPATTDQRLTTNDQPPAPSSCSRATATLSPRIPPRWAAAKPIRI